MTQPERERLIAQHIYIAEAEAGRFARRVPAIPLEDHYSAAVLGLLKATQVFDPSRGFAFKTAAGWWVRGEIKHQIRAFTQRLCCPCPL
jgi:DNA-directed RNA polymerase specialized sigma subunit